jgi:catechol 2,3-dioxygenase-like lactoylglutathione lyase family enzyme
MSVLSGYCALGMTALRSRPDIGRIVTMLNGGNATIFVSNVDTAVRFYTDVLGLKLTNRFGDHWATVQAGTTLTIGLHPWSAKYPAPGTLGSVRIGLVVSRDEPIADLAARLRRKGIEVSDVIRSQEGNYIHFTDPDGNPIYVGDLDLDAVADDASKEAIGSSAS